MTRGNTVPLIQLRLDVQQIRLILHIYLLLNTPSETYQHLHSQRQAVIQRDTKSVSPADFHCTSLLKYSLLFETALLCCNKYLSCIRCVVGPSAWNKTLLEPPTRLETFAPQSYPLTGRTPRQYDALHLNQCLYSYLKLVDRIARSGGTLPQSCTLAPL